jgi:tRNA pseudouridine55 synthase
VDRERIEAALRNFLGPIQQRPPAYSAIKIGGKRACDRVRAGQAVELEPRTVHVYRFDITEFEWPRLGLSIECGRGTYIRAIARDLGEALGVGGYLTELRRTAVGEYTIEDAVSVDELDAETVLRSLRE